MSFFQFSNSYSLLPERFYKKVFPEKSSNPSLLLFNHQLANEFNVNSKELKLEDLTSWFSGNELLPGSNPMALAYAGHQFGHFVPQLGDGRAHLLGEIVSKSGKGFDIQLKGSGRTPFSRGGDGKSSLGPVIREYIISEAMHALGVPTTRALAAVLTGDDVYRETSLPGGVFTRIASSHLRIGTFEYFAARNDSLAIKVLTEYAIKRHYQELEGKENIYLHFFEKVLEAQAKLVAHWMSLGFIHGVMNTDNTTISGETIDFGPCAFMDYFNFNQVYSSIDHQGRYAYKNQNQMALWNLCRLAECLIPIISLELKEEEAINQLNLIIQRFHPLFKKEWTHKLGKKLGIQYPQDSDEKLIQLWLEYLESESLDFTLSFRNLPSLYTSSANDFYPQTELFLKFKEPWLKRIQSQNIDQSQLALLQNKNNPLFIPRNHQVENAIKEAYRKNYNPFIEMVELLQRPYDENSKWHHYSLPPRPEQIVKQTFCGT